MIFQRIQRWNKYVLHVGGMSLILQRADCGRLYREPKILLRKACTLCFNFLASLEMCTYSIMTKFLQPYGLESARLLCPWDFSGKNTRVVSHFLLQGIFLTQGSNLGLLHCWWILYNLSHQQASATLTHEKGVRRG